MTLIEPKMDKLLDETDNDRFLLCSLASKRAHDINDMMRGQRDRAIHRSRFQKEASEHCFCRDRARRRLLRSRVHRC